MANENGVRNKTFVLSMAYTMFVVAETVKEKKMHSIHQCTPALVLICIKCTVFFFSLSK